MIHCPNKNLKEWSDLVEEVGEAVAYFKWNENASQKSSHTFYSKVTNSSEGIVASEKTLRDLAARMADRIGMKVVFEADQTKEYKGRIDYQPKGFGTRDEDYNASETVAIINLAHATLDTPIHEILGHPIIRAIKGNNFDSSDFQNWLKIRNKGQFNNSRKDYSSDEQYINVYKKEIEEYTKETGKTLYTEKSQLYQNLLKELETGKGKEVLDRIKRNYVNKEKSKSKNYNLIDKNNNSEIEIIQNFGNYWFKEYNETLTRGKQFNSNEELESLINKEQNKHLLGKYTLEEQQEEALVELLGLMTAGKLDSVKDGKLISLLKRLLKEMKAFVRSLLSQREVEIDKLPDNMTLGDLSDLLAYSNSKLILPGNEVIYTTPDNQQFKTYSEASRHISELIRRGEEVDLENIKLDVQKDKPPVQTIDEIPVSEFYSDMGVLIKKEGNNWVEYSEGGNWVLKDAQVVQEYNNINELTKDYSDRKGLNSFLEKNKEYEQSKEIIEEWKKVNNIQYNPEEIYSRGQEFVSVVGAYSSFDVNLMMQNLLSHIEDNEKANNHNKITSKDKIVFGHPTIGKSYLKQKGNNEFITLDDDYADEVNAFVDANRGFETRQEYKGRKPKEYNQFMLNLFDRLKIQAQKEGKKLFVSNTNILKERMSEFDKVITMPKDEFKKRFDARGATYGFEDWKSDIDTTVAKVDKSKVINTTGYLSDLFSKGSGFAISAYTKPIDKQIGHLEGGGGKIKFKLYPQSNDILWAANTDVYSGSVWDASEKVNKDKKSELLGVSYTKYPSLSNVNTVQPNLAAIVDDLAHHHNELGIVLTGNNFRLEYDENIPYHTKKIINSVNSILDKKYGRIDKPEIKSVKRLPIITDWKIIDGPGGKGMKFAVEYVIEYSDADIEFFETEEEARNFIEKRTKNSKEKIGLQPTQTNETLKESIDSVNSKFKNLNNGLYIPKEGQEIKVMQDNFYKATLGKYRLEAYDINTGKALYGVGNEVFDTEKEAKDFLAKAQNQKEYTSQALINTKIAALKEVAKKQPRSLIRSEVKRINTSSSQELYDQFGADELPFQKLSKSTYSQKQSSIEEDLLSTNYFAKRNGKVYIKKNYGIEARNYINQKFREFVKIQKEKIKGQLGRDIEYVTITPQGSIFQKEGKGDVSIPLNQLMEDFFRRAGFTLKMTDLPKGVNAQVSVKQTKDGFLRLVEVAKGKMKKDTLPEEAAHIKVMLMRDNPLTQKLIDQIDQTSYYEEAKRTHANDYSTDEEFRIEAVGQLIRDHIVKENAKAKSSLLKLVDAIWKWLTQKLIKVDELALNTEWNQIARQYAKDILLGDVSGEINQEFLNLQREEDFFDIGEDYIILNKKPLPDAVKNYIIHAKNTAALLKRQLHGAHKESNAKINSQIEKINNRVQELEQIRGGVFGLLVKYANDDIKQIGDKLSNFGAIEDKDRYYHVAMSNLSAWNNLDIMVVSGNAEIDKDVAEIASKARRLQQDLTKAYSAYTNTKGKEFTQEDFYVAHSDTSSTEALHMSLASSKIPELRYAYHVTEKAGYFANRAHKAFVAEKKGVEAKWEDWYKSKGMNRKQAIDMFMQKDSEGNNTGNFIHEISQDYYEEKRRQWVKNEKNKPIYYKWLSRNTVKVIDEERWGYAQENAKSDFTENGVLNQAKYDKWFKEHNPHKKEIDFAKTREYVKFEPNPLLWKDKRFEAIEKDAALKEIYDYVTEHFRERMSVMPYSNGPTNYLPEMKKGFNMGELGTQTLSKALVGLKNYFTTEIELPEHYNPTSVTGEQIKGIPVYMMSDTLSPEVKETDFWKVIEVFDEVSRTYEFRYQVEPIVLLIKDLFKQSKEKQVTPEGVPITSKITGIPDELLNANKHTLEALSYFMDSKFYDVTKEKLDRVSTTKAVLDEEGKTITEARGISLAHFGDILASWTRRKAMGLNLFAGAVNALFGTQTVLLHAAGGQDFTSSQVIKAFGICMNLGAVGTATYRKLYTLALKYNLFNDYSEIADMKSALDKGLFFFNEQTERFIRSLTMVSKMLNTEVEVDGKKMSLWEAHGNEGEVEVYSADEEYKLSSHLNALNDKLQGNYRDATLSQKNVLWRLAMVFRKWLPEAVNARIGAERTDERFTDGRKQKGRLRTFWEAVGDSKKVSEEGVSKGYIFREFGKEVLKQFGNSFFLGHQMITTETFKKLNEIDQVNMKKNAAALRMTLTIYLIGLLLMGLDSDDDRERLRLLHFAISSTYRLQGDMSFFLSPSQLTYMTQNILPVATTFEDFSRFFDAIPRAIMGNDEIEGGPYDGQSNLFRQTVKALPVSSQITKWIDLPNLNLKGK